MQNQQKGPILLSKGIPLPGVSEEAICGPTLLAFYGMMTCSTNSEVWMEYLWVASKLLEACRSGFAHAVGLNQPGRGFLIRQCNISCDNSRRRASLRCSSINQFKTISCIHDPVSDLPRSTHALFVALRLAMVRLISKFTIMSTNKHEVLS